MTDARAGLKPDTEKFSAHHFLHHTKQLHISFYFAIYAHYEYAKTNKDKPCTAKHGSGGCVNF